MAGACEVTVESTLNVLLVFLAVARLTRLVTRDYLTERPRRWLQAHLPEAGAYLLGCPWCASIWIAFPVVLVVAEWPGNRAVGWTVLALAASQVTGLLSTIDPADDYGTLDDDHDSTGG